MVWFLVNVFAGFLNGSFPLPMKYVRSWKWEHTWSMWSFWAFLILPIVITYLTVPHVLDIYSGNLGTVAMVFGVGCCYGIGAISFGLGVASLGMALGLSIIMGLTTSVGSLLPLAFMDTTGIALWPIFLAVFTIVLGILICSYAGHLKEKMSLTNVSSDKIQKQGHFARGLLICIIAGIGGACLNFAFTTGAPLTDKAADYGVSSYWTANTVWAIALPGAFLVNAGYCVYLMLKNQNVKQLLARGSGRNWALALLMGIAWTGSVLLYGIAADKLGRIGPSIGWASFLGTAIVIGNIWGIITGEWKDSGKKALTILLVGVLFIIVGVGITAYSKA
jgi:L-rhamnose-H+ transport protein